MSLAIANKRKLLALLILVSITLLTEYTMDGGLSESAADLLKWTYGLFCGGNAVEHVAKFFGKNGGGGTNASTDEAAGG